MAFQLNVTVLPAVADDLSTDIDGTLLLTTTGGVVDVVPPGIVIFSEVVVPFLFGQES